MKITKIVDKCYKVEADEGKKFVAKDLSAVYDAIMYVPNDNPEIEEMTEAEADKIKAELESRYAYADDANKVAPTIHEETVEDATPVAEEASDTVEETASTVSDDLVTLKLTKEEAEKLREYLASK